MADGNSRGDSFSPIPYTHHIRRHLRAQCAQRSDAHHSTDDQSCKNLRHDLEDDDCRQQAESHDNDWGLQCTTGSEAGVWLGEIDALRCDSDEITSLLKKSSLLLNDRGMLTDPSPIGRDVGVGSRREVLGQLGVGSKCTVWEP